MNITEQKKSPSPTIVAEVTESTGTLAAPKSLAPKSSAVIKLLSCAKGATLAEISTATGWQPHSCRAFLTGLRKKGKELIKEQRSDGSTTYRIVATIPEVVAP